jgi:multicomponent Na+:H+ antiporter subunit A
LPAVSIIFPVGALLAGVVLEALFIRVLSQRAKGWLAFVCSLIALWGVFAIRSKMQGMALDARLSAWAGPISLSYHVDGLGLFFAVMALGIGAAVLLYSIAYMADDPSASRFYILMLVFIAGLVHLVFAADLFVMYISWEVIGLCSFLLVGFWYENREAAYGARKVLVMTHLAGYGFLAAVLILYARTGATLWTDPKVAAAFTSGIFLLMLAAAVAKSVQFPLHTWIPDAMAAPTPVSALLHAACYVKAGVYLVARMHSFGPWPVSWQLLVVWIGTVTMVVGVLYAMVQHDLKRLLAFHTVSQIGYMMLGLGLSTSLGIAAGLLHCLNHGLFKGGLFLCAGAVQKATGTRDMDRLGGLGRRMPVTMISWLIGAGAISGVPLLSGFVSKWLIYNAALEAGQVIPALIAWMVSVLTLFSFLKATSAVFLADEGPDSARGREAPRAMIAGSAVLAAGSVVFGLAPQVVVNYLVNPMLLSLGLAPCIGVSWMGLTVGNGSWFSTAGLAMVVLSLALGFIVYRMAVPAGRRVLSAAGGSATVAPVVFSGGDPMAGAARVSSSDFSLVVKNGLAPFYRLTDVDSLYLGVWRRLLRFCDMLQKGVGVLERRAAASIAVLALIVGSLAWYFSGAGGIAASSAAEAPVWPIRLGVGLACLALLFIGYAGLKDRGMLPLWAGAGLLSVLALSFEAPFVRLAFLEGAALIALALVWKASGKGAARRIYLLMVLLSAAATAVGTAALDSGKPGLVLALLIAGFCLKLALAPLSLWLPMVAEAIPAPLAGLVVGVLDVAAFGELLVLRQTSAWLFAPTQLWLAIALVSAVGGAVLMLAQRDLKRMLAFSTIEDMGYLILGVTAGTELGITGAALGVGVHALAKALLFGSLTAAEGECGPVTLGSGGLASRYPWSAAAFLAGSLAMLGIPPLAGFAARWQLYETAIGIGPVFLGALLLATALSVLAYSRALVLCWWGPAPAERSGKGEPALLVAAMVGLCLILLAIGLWPPIWSM